MDERVRNLFKADGKNAIHDGVEHEPSGGKALFDPTDTVLLLLDHQSGPFQNVKDITVAELRSPHQPCPGGVPIDPPVIHGPR